MEVSHQLFTLLIYVFNSCCAIILVKFGTLPLHYMKNSKNGVQLPDPLAEFDLRARQLLCDSVISARQFMQRYYYVKRKKLKAHARRDFSAVFADTTWNYQRSSNVNASTHGYKLRSTQIGKKYIKIKSLCCVYTKTVEWYLTFGLVDHFMYLLERSQNRAHPDLLLTGIIEPRPLIRQESLLYFRSQLMRGKSKMESLCKKPQGDKIRICGAIYNALGMGNRARFNYYMESSHKHIVRKLHSRYRDPRKFKFLQCNFFIPESGLESFYALADIYEQSAVFVFFEDETRSIVVEMTRVTKIGALLNPSVLRKQRQKTKILDKDFSTSDSDDESCKRRKKIENFWKNKEISKQVVQLDADNVEGSDGSEEKTSCQKEHKEATKLSNFEEQLDATQNFIPTTSSSHSRKFRDKGSETDSEGPPEEKETMSSLISKMPTYTKRKRSKFKKLGILT